MVPQKYSGLICNPEKYMAFDTAIKNKELLQVYIFRVMVQQISPDSICRDGWKHMENTDRMQ